MSASAPKQVPRKPGKLRRLLRGPLGYAAYCLFTAYVLAEIGYSTLYRHYYIDPMSIWCLEDNGAGTVRFDPKSGFRLGPKPGRFAAISYGVLEYVGVYRGNNQGFPDRGDFGPERPAPNTIRLAVLGDSFTAAPYIETNWPDATEDLFREHGMDVQLLNFSLDGIGLANWYSILFRIIRDEHYDIDGLIFPVFAGDLGRQFLVNDQVTTDSHMIGHSDSWDPKDWPRTLEEIPLIPMASKLSPVDFQILIEGGVPGCFTRPWRFYMTRRLLEKAGWPSLVFGLPAAYAEALDGPEAVFEAGQLTLIRGIRDYAQSKALPVLVIDIPLREPLVHEIGSGGAYPAKAEEMPYVEGDAAYAENSANEGAAFATILGAQYMDGHNAFGGLNREEIFDCYFPYDGHWNQRGSDQFAEFFSRMLPLWLQTVAPERLERAKEK